MRINPDGRRVQYTLLDAIRAFFDELSYVIAKECAPRAETAKLCSRKIRVRGRSKFRMFLRACVAMYLGQVVRRAVGTGVIGVARIGRVRVRVAVRGIRHGRSGVCTVGNRRCVSAQQQPSLVSGRFRRAGHGLCRFDGLFPGGFRLRESRGGHQGEQSDSDKALHVC